MARKIFASKFMRELNVGENVLLIGALFKYAWVKLFKFDTRSNEFQTLSLKSNKK